MLSRSCRQISWHSLQIGLSSSLLISGISRSNQIYRQAAWINWPPRQMQILRQAAAPPCEAFCLARFLGFLPASARSNPENCGQELRDSESESTPFFNSTQEDWYPLVGKGWSSVSCDCQRTKRGLGLDLDRSSFRIRSAGQNPIKPIGAMDRITMPSALLSCLLLIPLRGQDSCQKQVVIGHRGR